MTNLESTKGCELDLPSILARLGNDRSLLDELIDIYITDVGPLIQDLTEAIDERDAERSTRAAHSIKGLASNFGVNPVTSAALKIEKQARVGDWTEIEQSISELERHTTSLKQLLPQFKNSVGD